MLAANIREKTFYKAMWGRYESEIENGKNGSEAILSRVDIQTGPYKTSILNTWKYITVYPKQNFVVDTFA